MVKKNNQEKKNRKTGCTAWSSRVKGDEEALGNNVFDYGQQGKMNQFNKTFEAIISHIGRTYPQPGNVIKSLRNEKAIDIEDIQAPDYEEETGKDAAEIRVKRIRTEH